MSTVCVPYAKKASGIFSIRLMQISSAFKRQNFKPGRSISFDGYKSYWNYADKKGYSGTAIFSKHDPLSVSYGIGVDEHDHEGRVITLEMPNFFLVTCYTPNSQDELKRLEYRMTWEDDFRSYLLSLEAKGKPVIVCGDLNVAHQEIDLKNPKTNHECRIHRRRKSKDDDIA